MTMGASDVVTDLLLVGYPITIVMQSGLPKKRFVLCLPVTITKSMLT